MKELVERSFSLKRELSEVLWEVYPHPKFPSISITGAECSLNCDFCGGKYLEDMRSAEDPDRLYEICRSLDSQGCGGVLLSGGFNDRGYVPFEPFVEAIERIDRDTDLFLSMHPGLLPRNLSSDLSDAGMECVYFDLIADDGLIGDRMGLDRTVEDYERVLNGLMEDFSYVSPHVLLGLSDSLKSERKVLDSFSGYDFSVLVFLVLIPQRSDESFPSPEEVREYLAEARQKFPETPIALGCMRPRNEGRKRMEINAIAAGVDRIVQPSEEAKKIARKAGLEVHRVDACCGVPESLVRKWQGD